MEARLLSAVLDAVPVAALAVDARARVTAANNAARALLGPALTDRPFVTVLRHPAVVAALDHVLDPARHPAPPLDPGLPPAPEGGVRLRAVLAAQGRDHACDVTISRMPAGAGIAALVALEDLTAIEQAEQMRRDFVANVSHELRTPLTALMGFIETLQGPARDDAAARARFLGIMAGEAGRMNRLVADLLSLTRVESEERRRPLGPVDLDMVLRQAAEMLTPWASGLGVGIVVSAAGHPVPVPGDADQILQVLTNLIENAVKYGGAGGEVRVLIQRLPHEAMLRGPAWAIEVADKGEGIDPQHLPRLTERFYRVDTHRSRAQGGTGLGLAIVKHIVNRHRGRLRIESVRGQGSRFTVILPEASR